MDAIRRNLLIEEIKELRFLIHRDRGLPGFPVNEDLEKHNDEALQVIAKRLRFAERSRSVSRTPPPRR